MADIYNRAIWAFGTDAQWAMVQEECAELIAAINQWRRGRLSDMELVEEIADVAIMVEQARLMAPASAVDKAMRRKLRLLEQRVSEAERDE